MLPHFEVLGALGDDMSEATLSAPTSMVQVVSTPPSKVEEGSMVIEWSRRSTDKNPLPEAQRYRGIVIPASQLKVPDDSASSKFLRLLQGTIHDLAQALFVEKIKDQMEAIQIDGAAFTVDLVLAYWAEEKQRQSVDAAKITEWLKSSATFKVLNDAQKKGWLEKVPKIAAPSYQGIIRQGEAAAIVSRIVEEDLQHPIAIFILTRANKILSLESVETAL